MGVGDELGATVTRAAPSRWSGPAALPGRIGAYRVLRELGAGGMGVVYAGHDEALDRDVAIKLVHAHVGGTTGGRASVVREAQALARLSHPNVVQVYEVGEHEGQLFVAMEHVHGETLDVWQRRPGRRLAELLDAYRQAATGLKAAHDAGLVHRDFKPANAIVADDGRVRVLDFGLAHVRSRPVDADEGVAGTPAYMSPEQFAGGELDARSDVFSLCVALWEALHGARPFAGETFDELAASVGAGRRTPPPPGVDLPGRLRHALERGLACDREARWASLDPLLAALAADPDADPTAAGRERKILFAALAAVLVVVILPLLALTTREHVDRRVFHAAAVGVGLVTLAVVSAALRRTLLRNAYHRRMILFIGAIMLVVFSQRTIAIVRDAPADAVLLADAHVVIGMCLVGAIFFARWLLVLAALVAAAVLAGQLAPGLFPAGMVVVGPAFSLTLGLFWRLEARRGAD